MPITDPIRYGDAAGGALQGTYPNPDIQDGYIQTRHISLEAITNELIANGTITGEKLSSGTGLGEVITVPENIASGVITSAHLADIITYIRNQGNQTLSGTKSFERALQYRWPTIPADLANKHYVDSSLLSGSPDLAAYASGIETMRRAMTTGDTTAVTTYASGINGQLILVQNIVTATNDTLSGLNTSIIEIENYASGINNTTNNTQINLTSNTNTLSGVITDLQELTEYASGIGARPTGGTSTATGSSIRQTYIQTNDFSALTPIYRTTGEQWAKAKADNIITAESIGIIESTSGNQFTAVFEGEIDNQSGLLPGLVYFLSADIAGQLTPTEPTTSGSISKPVMVAISSTKGIVVSYRGILNGVSGSSTGGDTAAIEAYASGIESMRQAMVTGGDTTAVTTYASGINSQLILVQQHVTEVELFASGIQTGSTGAITTYASGIELQVVNIQNEQTVTNTLLSNTLSGVNGQLVLIQTELGTNTNTLSGVITDLQELTEYASGIETLRQAMEPNILNIKTYASGINDQLSDIQIAQTTINTTLSNTISGVNGQVVLVQGELTSTRNTLSGVITDTREIESYCSGNKVLLLNHADQHRENATDEVSAMPFNGFVNHTDSIISVSGNGVILTPNTQFIVYSNGYKFIKNIIQSVPVVQNYTQHYIYFDTNGDIQVSSTIWEIDSDIITIATAYKSDSVIAVHEERHGYKANRAWHEWAHHTIGCRYEAGFAGTFTNNTFSIDSGTIHDEDNELVISAQTGGRLWYRTDAGARMSFVSGTTITPYSTAGTLNYDNNGVLTPVGAAQFVANYIYATNDLLLPIYIIVGQTEHSTIAQARNDNLPSLANILTAEWKLLYRVIYQNSGGNPTYVEAADYRQVSTGPASSYTPSSHTNLTNRDASNSHPVTAITGLDSYLSGTKTLINVNQTNITNLSIYASGIQEQLSDFQISQTTFNTNIEAFASGTNTLSILNQTNATSTTTTLSGINASLINLTTYASGIESLRQSMTTGGDTTAITAYASGINTNLINFQNNALDLSTNPTNVSIVSASPGSGNKAAPYNHQHLINLGDETGTFSESSKVIGYFGGEEPGLQKITGTGIINGIQSNFNISGINTRITTLENASGGNATKQIITHDDVFQTLNAVYCDSNKVWQKSKADTLNNSEVVGVVESTSGNSSTIVMNGVITNNLITAGLVYYLSDVTDGALQTSEATNISKPVMIGIDSGVGIVQIFRSLVVSGSSSAIDLPRSYLAGYGTAPYTTSGISVAAGSARSDDNEFNIITSNTIVKKLTGPFVAGSLQNGIDSGNRAASTTYHVHEITDGTNVDTLFSTSATSPTLPSGYVAARRIMSFKTNATGWIPSYSQYGDVFRWSTVVDDMSATPTAGTQVVTITVPTGIIVQANVYAWYLDTTPGRYVLLRDYDNNVYGSNAPVQVNSIVFYGSASTHITNTSAQIKYTASNSSGTLAIRTNGWIDTRGRDN